MRVLVADGKKKDSFLVTVRITTFTAFCFVVPTASGLLQLLSALSSIYFFVDAFLKTMPTERNSFSEDVKR